MPDGVRVLLPCGVVGLFLLPSDAEKEIPVWCAFPLMMVWKRFCSVRCEVFFLFVFFTSISINIYSLTLLSFVLKGGGIG